MVRKNDLILLLVIFCSMGAGIGFPNLGKVFLPYPLYLMMFLLFISFLKIEFFEVLQNIKKTTSIILLLCLLKLLIIPVGLFFLAQAIWPEYALPVLLLSGISTGVVAPFVSVLLNATTSLVLMMVVISSLIAPFTLPALVEVGRLEVCGEQQERRQSGRGHRVSLGERLCCVADGVQGVGDVARLRRGARHLDDAVGVVGNGDVFFVV